MATGTIKKVSPSVATVTGATNSAAYFATTLSRNDITIIAAGEMGHSYIVIPFMVSGYWYFKVLTNSDLAKVANTEVTVTYNYI